MSQSILRLSVSVLAVGLLMTGCGGKRTDPVTDGSVSNQASCEVSAGRITIATGNAGGVFYALGGGLAQLISDNTELKASAAETGGSTQNIQQLVAGTYDIAFSGGEPVADAVAGNGIFEGKPQRIRALARIYPNYTHVLVRADTGVDSLADLRGKRVSTGAPKSATEVIAHRLLRAAGLDPDKDIQAQRLDLTKAVDGFKSGTIDALFWAGGLPTAQITDLTTSLKDGVKFIDVTPHMDEIKEISPVYDRGIIPAAAYRQPADVPAIVESTILLVREDFPVGSACAITKLIFEKKGELERIHPAARDISLDKARQTDPVQLHPGASQALDALGG